jgi:hypothetical protein
MSGKDGTIVVIDGRRYRKDDADAQGLTGKSSARKKPEAKVISTPTKAGTPANKAEVPSDK